MIEDAPMSEDNELIGGGGSMRKADDPILWEVVDDVRELARNMERRMSSIMDHLEGIQSDVSALNAEVQGLKERVVAMENSAQYEKQASTAIRIAIISGIVAMLAALSAALVSR
jgi:hypothetical protein